MTATIHQFPALPKKVPTFHHKAHAARAPWFLRVLWGAVTLAVLSAGLWQSVRFMVWALSLWAPERFS